MGKGDGKGSIRLGTPTAEQRDRQKPQFLGSFGGTAQMPLAKKTPAARFGYMPPEYGRLAKDCDDDQTQQLSEELESKICSLFEKMKHGEDAEYLTRECAHKFLN